MYLDEAISRINKIDWNKSEELISKDKQYFGYEYMRRMANFMKEQDINPLMNPLFLNVASVLGYTTDKDYIKCCSTKVQETLKNRGARYTVSFYLQLADYADKRNAVESYLQIYEPMIRLLELGYKYGYREGGLMIYQLSLYPLRGWYERFVDAPPRSFG